MKKLNLLFCFVFFLGITLYAQDPWQQQTGPTSPARYGHSMVKIDNMIYVYGGESTTSRNILNDIWQYNDTNGDWEELVPANPPAGRKYHAAAAKDGKMYVFFGETAETGITQEVWEYDPQDTNWTQKNNGGPQVPLMRIHHRAVSGPDKIWITGGTLSEIFDETWAYDVNTQQWEKGASFEGARYGHVTSYHDDKLYVFGGADDQGFKNDMQSYSISTQQWSNVQFSGDAPVDIKFSAFATHNNTLCVHGGTTKVNGSYPEVGTVSKFNIQTKNWTPGTGKFSVTLIPMITIGDAKDSDFEMLIFGGLREGQALDEAWIYNSAFDPLNSLPEVGIDMPVNIYPTYTNGILNVKGIRNIEEISVFNMQGQLVFSQDANDTEIIVNLGGNSPGTYFIKVLSDRAYSGGKIMLTK